MNTGHFHRWGARVLVIGAVVAGLYGLIVWAIELFSGSQ